METSADPDAEFEAFYREWWGVSLRLARRLAGTSLAEEVASDAFFRAAVHWRRLKDLPHAGPWVLRVTVRIALRRRRQAWRTIDEHPAPPPLLIEDLVVTQLAVTEALAALPRRQREVLALQYLADLSERETASALRLSANTVKTHTRRGLATLRRNWVADMEPSEGG